MENSTRCLGRLGVGAVDAVDAHHRVELLLALALAGLAHLADDRVAAAQAELADHRQGDVDVVRAGQVAAGADERVVVEDVEDAGGRHQDVVLEDRGVGLVALAAAGAAAVAVAVAVAAAAAPVAAAAARPRRRWSGRWSCWPSLVLLVAGCRRWSCFCWRGPAAALVRSLLAPGRLLLGRPGRGCPGCRLVLAVARAGLWSLAALAPVGAGPCGRPLVRSALGVGLPAGVGLRAVAVPARGARWPAVLPAVGWPLALAAAWAALIASTSWAFFIEPAPAMPMPPAIDLRSASSMELSPPPRFLAGGGASGRGGGFDGFRHVRSFPRISADTGRASRRRAGQCFLAAGARRIGVADATEAVRHAR